MPQNRCEALKPAPVSAPPSVLNVLRSQGTPLDRATRARFEPRFGHDFSRVRVHADSSANQSAREVGAQAWTVGHDVAFASGRFRPGTAAGDSLLAHELTHVVQQDGVSRSGSIRMGGVHDPAEAEADRAKPARQLSEPTLQRRPESGDPLHGDETDAAAKYYALEPKQDLSRVRIEPVSDFLVKDLTAPQNVGVTVTDSGVKSIEWELSGPGGNRLDSSATKPGDADAIKRPFQLKPSHFTAAAKFKPGRHLLTCRGISADGLITVKAIRDFNVLESDLTTGTAVAGTYGQLKFTEYSKTDAAAPGGLYKLVAKLDFLPKDTVSCTDVVFLQAVQVLDATGKSLMPNVGPEITERSTPMGWSIDQTEGQRSPYYITETDPVTHAINDDAGLGKAGTGGATPGSATLGDAPQTKVTSTNFHFESCAVCRSGKDIGTVYSCATWGYSADAAGKIKLMPRSVADGPSWIMRAAGESWNKWNKNKPATPARLEVPTLK